LNGVSDVIAIATSPRGKVDRSLCADIVVDLSRLARDPAGFNLVLRWFKELLRVLLWMFSRSLAPPRLA
jgi:hypothetical protein